MRTNESLAAISSRTRDGNKATVVIIGAGISGICTAIEMIRKNKSTDFIILEKGNNVGGTWNDNKYPGACCDVWSHLYSLSFELNPNWTHEYSGQEEILDYWIGVAQKWGLYRYIRFNTSVDEARWDETELKWKTKVTNMGGKTAEYNDSYTLTSDYLVSAVGQLNIPHYPEIPGLDKYEGKKMHSARWDWTYDIKGKKVAIIGNGATAAQIIPEVAKEASSFTVYQRTPNWIVPRADAPISETRKAIYKYVPGAQKRYRAALMDVREYLHGFTLPDHPVANMLRDQSLALMEEQIVNKPELKAKLVPDYPLGCKRIIITDDLFPTYDMPHVTLETEKIDSFTSKGVKLVNGSESEYDLVILATGFRTVEFMYPIKVIGAGGRSIEDIWKSGAEALLGMNVASLPNFSMLYGPNTNLGHNSIILMIEAQSRYINALIGAVMQAKEQRHTLIIAPKAEKLAEFNKDVQDVLSRSAFASPSCKSWYKNADGKVTNNWSGTVVEYQKKTSEVDWANYDVEGTGKDVLLKKGKLDLGRVREETLVSDTALTIGAALTTAVVVAGLVAKNFDYISRQLRVRG